MKLIALFSVLLLMTACDQKTAASHEDKRAAQADGNKMNCVAGDVKLAGAGAPEVEIGGFGIQGETLNAFGLSLNVERAGKVHQVSSSLMALPLQAGTYHFPALNAAGPTLAFYNIRTRERDLLKGYNGGTYGQQFSAIEHDPEAKLKVQVDKVTVADAAQAGFKRVHAVGHFEFNAAALPASGPSDACASNGIARSLESVKAGKRLLPLYDAAICGAEKKHVQCDFDVAADFVRQQ
ncbi:MAG: hypothetical protein V4463_13260 [Pseudomonadota bacterium]